MMIKKLNTTAYVVVLVALFLSFGVFASEPEKLVPETVTEEMIVDSQAESSVVEAETVEDNSYVLGVDDSIKIVVYGEKDLSSTYKIGSTGKISFPLIGEIEVNGLTLSQVEGLLKSKLTEGYLKNPSISIEVASYRSFYILGEVRAPGSYNYQNDITVLKAVALAGGFTYRANKKNVQILKTRKDGSDLYDRMPVSASIEPGDIVLVKERFF